MIHLALKTEFSFKKAFLHIGDIHKYVVDGCVGIADINSTYGHIPLMKEAKKHGFKPIFGVRLHVLPGDSVQRVCNQYYIFIAMNQVGLAELYKLVQTAYKNFYYLPKLNQSDLWDISDNLIAISPINMMGDYQAAGQGYGKGNLAIDNNEFPEADDREVYELLAGARKNGEGYSYFYQDQSYPQHILSHDEWLSEYSDHEAIVRTHTLAKEIEHIEIPQADMVKWTGAHDIFNQCLKSTKIEWNDEYLKRLEYEIELIKSKGYVDYFLITADMIKHAYPAGHTHHDLLA